MRLHKNSRVLTAANLVVAVIICNSCGAAPPLGRRGEIIPSSASKGSSGDSGADSKIADSDSTVVDLIPSPTPTVSAVPTASPDPTPSAMPSVSPAPLETGNPTTTPAPTVTPTPKVIVIPSPTPPPALQLASKFPAQVDAALASTCAADLAGGPQVSGTAGDDVLDGTAASERVVGLAGNDTLRGLDGNDFMNGNEGNDTVNGNMGNDRVHGGKGNDTVMGGAGNDCVSGDLDNDIVVGGGGGDFVQGGDGTDTLWPRSQTREPTLDCSDSSFASCSVDWLSGGAGDDTYRVGDGDGRVIILPDGSGANTLQCTSNSTIVTSDEGPDRYLLGNGFVIKIVGFNAGQTIISFSGCD